MSCWPGDWTCAACHHRNFKRRDSCQRCGRRKCATEDDMPPVPVKPGPLPGDWYCGEPSCRALNYASRTTCYLCGASKNCGFCAGNMANSGYPDISIPGWKPGDWICPRPDCSTHNYAIREECYNCKTAKIPEEQYRHNVPN